MGVRFPPGVLLTRETCYNKAMETYTYEVRLTVEMEALDSSDAWEAVQDAFGLGDNCGVRVVDCEYTEITK